MATTEAPPTGANGSAWLPISEAAARLGVSQDAVRRRLKAGALQGKREAMPQGFRWLVLLDGDDQGDAAQGGATRHVGATSEEGTPQPGAQVAELAAARAQEMARYSAALLAPLHARLEALAGENGALRERLAAAEARVAELEPPVPAPPETESAPPMGDPVERGWWARLRAWLSGEPARPAEG